MAVCVCMCELKSLSRVCSPLHTSMFREGGSDHISFFGVAKRTKSLTHSHTYMCIFKWFGLVIHIESKSDKCKLQMACRSQEVDLILSDISFKNMFHLKLG